MRFYWTAPTAYSLPSLVLATASQDNCAFITMDGQLVEIGFRFESIDYGALEYAE